MGTMANVSAGGEVSETFGVTNGVKQGYVLASILFSIFLSAMFSVSMGDNIWSRHKADLFKVTHFSTKTKTNQILVREMLFADDSALVDNSAEAIQKIVADTILHIGETWTVYRWHVKSCMPS